MLISELLNYCPVNVDAIANEQIIFVPDSAGVQYKYQNIYQKG